MDLGYTGLVMMIHDLVFSLSSTFENGWKIYDKHWIQFVIDNTLQIYYFKVKCIKYRRIDRIKHERVENVAVFSCT